MDDKKYLIYLPTRPQPDTLVALYLLFKYGEKTFAGIRNYEIRVYSDSLETDQNSHLIYLDCGNGEFDHHDKNPQVTATELVAGRLNILRDPSIGRMLAYAKRDDFHGKGTISNDALDRAFGLSGLIASLNKKYTGKPENVVKVILPLLDAHHEEEIKRHHEMPEEMKLLKTINKVYEYKINNEGKDYTAICVESDNISLSGYLRSKMGGNYDVVIQKLSSGHVNILTNQRTRMNLVGIISKIRIEQARVSGIIFDEFDAGKEGKISAIPQWYYDPATNSIQNGGVNPGLVPPTTISWDFFKSL